MAGSKKTSKIPCIKNAKLKWCGALRDGGSIEIHLETDGEIYAMRLMRDFSSWNNGNLDKIEIWPVAASALDREIVEKDQIEGFEGFLKRNQSQFDPLQLKALLGLAPLKKPLPTLEEIFGKMR